MTPLSILKSARQRISDPKRWTQGKGARSADGASADPTAPNACAWCAVGAILAEAKLAPEMADAMHLLGESVPGGWVAPFNDSHTHTEVLAAFDKAIAKIETGGRKRPRG